MSASTSTGFRRVAALALLPWAVACGDDGVNPGDGDDPLPIALEEVVSGLSATLFLTSAPGDTTRLFVIERGGLIHIVRGGAVEPTPFLDLSGSVTPGGEQGLLGLAFHPQYGTNGYFYVNYTDASGHTQVSRFTVSANADVADAGSEVPVLFVEQPYTNHNGGMLAFGPDGMLYVAMGDGGSDGGDGDPEDHGQRPATLLGSLLRIDVDSGSPYAIPLDNPFLGHATYREETWAYGLRNPWRFSFDRQTGALWIGDVGQNAVEEISFQPSGSAGGENYGWRIMEGTSCHNPSSGCSTSDLTPPVYEYGHGPECSVTGGYVYRGADFPSFQGRYFFGDFCAGWIRSFVLSEGEATDVQDHTAGVGTVSTLSSFGEDARGELYVVSLGGTIYRITEPATTP